MTGRERASWIVSGIGALMILAGVLYMTDSSVGGPVREFSERRTYTEVKVAAQRAWPITMALGLAGLGLVMLGSRMRSRTRGRGDT